MELTTYSSPITVPAWKGKDEQRVGAGVSGDGGHNFNFFPVPKNMDLLQKVDPKLEQLIDWGCSASSPSLCPVLNYTADKLTHNWGCHHPRNRPP